MTKVLGVRFLDDADSASGRSANESIPVVEVEDLISDATNAVGAGAIPSRIRSTVDVVLGAVVGLIIGIGGTAVLLDSAAPTGEMTTSAAIPGTPDPAVGGLYGSADAAERWLLVIQQRRAGACTSSPASADSLERCVTGT